MGESSHETRLSDRDRALSSNARLASADGEAGSGSDLGWIRPQLAAEATVTNLGEIEVISFHGQIEPRKAVKRDLAFPSDVFLSFSMGELSRKKRFKYFPPVSQSRLWAVVSVVVWPK